MFFSLKPLLTHIKSNNFTGKDAKPSEDLFPIKEGEMVSPSVSLKMNKEFKCASLYDSQF